MQKGFMTYIIGVIIAVVLVAAVYLLMHKSAQAPSSTVMQTPTTAAPTNAVQAAPIENSAGLSTASSDLDTTNVDSMDSDLNQIGL